jgi:3-oxoacyl-[acyl-carrier protein] reductase
MQHPSMVNLPGRMPEYRVAIVTGGSRGIGGETVHRLAKLGYAVIVNYAHHQQTAESIVEAILADNGAAVAVRADVADELDVERLFAVTLETFGAIDAVVHAVPGHVPTGTVTNFALDALDAVYKAGLRTTFLVNRAAAHHVREGGAIVNLACAVCGSSLPAYGAFATVSAATEALVRVLADELLARNVSVNGVSVVIDRLSALGSVVDLIIYLLGTGGHGVTGQVFRMDGRSIDVGIAH